MRPRLIAASGPLEGETFELGEDRFTVGRQEGNDLRLTGLEVSRRHCEIHRGDGGRFTLRDLGSSHGTFINGRPVREKELLHSDLVTVGTSVLLFLLDDPSSDSPLAATLDPRPAAGDILATRKPAEVLHLDAARVDAALPKKDRLARELHALLRLSETLQETLELKALAERLLDAAFEAVPAEHGAVLLRESGLEQPLTLAERGQPNAASRTVVARVLDEGVAIFSPLISDDPELAAVKSVGDTGTLIAAPLAGEAEPLGVLYLDRRSAGFASRHLELATAIAGVASLALRNALHLRWLETENRRLREESAERHDMIGESAVMRRLFDLIARVARADSTVLVHGETGTGKELVARAIHRASPRAEGPLVAVNCATLSENLLESELFGHEKGAFTGAATRKIGKMQAAHRGTLFLDEVAEIPIDLQAKLLRALQEREVERVGGSRPIPVDVRVVAASHRDLEQAVRDGDLRDDLYYRLKVITAEVPPLRRRRDDVPLLASHFARRHARRLGIAGIGIAPEARRSLLAYDWPGNVRELGNVIERAVVLGDGEVVRREDLPDEVAACGGEETPADRASEETADFQSALVAYKKRLILDAWRLAGGDYAATAERLGVHVNSLHRMIRNLDLKDRVGR